MGAGDELKLAVGMLGDERILRMEWLEWGRGEDMRVDRTTLTFHRLDDLTSGRLRDPFRATIGAHRQWQPRSVFAAQGRNQSSLNKQAAWWS